MANTENDKVSEDSSELSQSETVSGPERIDEADAEMADNAVAPPEDSGTDDVSDQTPSGTSEGQLDAPRDLADTLDEASASWDETRAEPVQEPAATPKPVPAAPAPQRKGGFLAPLIGGVLAAGLGYGAAQYVKPEGWPFPGAGLGQEAQAALSAAEARLAETQDQVAALQDQVAELAGAAGAGAETLAPEISALAEQMTALAERVSTLDARMEELAKAQLAVVGEESAEAVAAYEREIALMREELAAQRDENAKLADSVTAVANEAEAEIGAAMDRAAQVEARAALMRIDAALANGAAFDSALGQFGAIEVPEGLARVASSGVATLPELQIEFPPAARAALDAALAVEAAGGVGDRLNAFMRSQLGLRSLEPREGDDADAVLSRAEAALRGGELRAALAELDALPDPPKAEMADWIAQAVARADAVEAAEALEQSLNN
ncbi:COG4223 family protein [Rhodovulum euryhalinum]|uniref:Inner membrane protein n=1 Tax=Rhodovulum euryhalinum TaxID=35805 RepID=A0A4R2KLK1_9RHOB|nr:hypothetical protein [Rhodovulum euryhalinum]TCO73397.1 hypothetical protein EV655_102162 [Rhodovulum euryhalinum]